jgi:hypothetical protein
MIPRKRNRPFARAAPTGRWYCANIGRLATYDDLPALDPADSASAQIVCADRDALGTAPPVCEAAPSRSWATMDSGSVNLGTGDARARVAGPLIFGLASGLIIRNEPTNGMSRASSRHDGTRRSSMWPNSNSALLAWLPSCHSLGQMTFLTTG